MRRRVLLRETGGAVRRREPEHAGGACVGIHLVADGSGADAGNVDVAPVSVSDVWNRGGG